MAKLPSNEEIEAAVTALEPYQLALGKVAHAWNHMQENLGMLFCGLSGLDDTMGLGIWHALKSDRSQRDLLEAAILAASLGEDFNSDFPTAKEDIEWLLKKVNALADGRNSAIHAPIFSLTSGEAEIRPLTIYRNPNAAKLLGKDILAEFEWYEAYFVAIRKYAAAICLALASRHPATLTSLGPWPDRPLLPTVQRKRSHQDRSCQSAPE
jgi:hypothetical protein